MQPVTAHSMISVAAGGVVVAVSVDICVSMMVNVLDTDSGVTYDSCQSVLITTAQGTLTYRAGACGSSSCSAS